MEQGCDAPTLVSPVAAAFDFDDDGAVEAVLADIAGAPRAEGAATARSLGELAAARAPRRTPIPQWPTLDGDGKADILLGSVALQRQHCRGLYAFGESRDGWVRARPLWNQYEYAVPGESSWRANGPARGGASSLRCRRPDASFVRRSENGSDFPLTVTIGNAGVGTARAGVPVAAYNGDPRLGAAFVASTADLARSRARRVRGRRASSSEHREAQGSVFVVADDAGRRLRHDRASATRRTTSSTRASS